MLKRDDLNRSEAHPALIGPTLPKHRDEFDLNILRTVMGPSTRRFEPLFVPVLDSTMNLAGHCYHAGIPVRPGLVVIAGTQTHGVGRSGTWESSAQSKDVTMSVVLSDTLCPKTHLLLHIASTLAVANALDRAACLEPKPESEQPLFRIKLPNDVRVDCREKFGKICGSLGVGALNSDIKTEHRVRGWHYPDNLMIMGIGINLSDDVLAHQSRLRFPAASLERVTGRLFPREMIIGMVLHELERTMALLDRDQNALIHEAWTKLAVGPAGAAILDTRSGFSGAVHVVELSPAGLTYMHRDERHTTPLEDVLRLYPEEQPTNE